MISLSYSTINQLYKSSHYWINKQMGIQVPDNPAFATGRRLHRIIQDHVSGYKLDDRLNIKYTFDVVERVDFDPKCKISFKINEKYKVIGFLDGFNTVENRTLEIKTGTKLWTLGDFQRTMQRRIYSIARPEMVENLLITALSDEEQWLITPPKIYKIPVTQKDKDEAMEWIMGGIKIIESGNFTGGLDEDGICRDRFCYHGANCYFKRGNV